MSRSRAIANILKVLKKAHFATDTTLSMRYWGWHETFDFLYRLKLMGSYSQVTICDVLWEKEME